MRRLAIGVRVWCIGSTRTEYFAAYSEDEMRRCYIEMVGKEQAETDFAMDFIEVPESELDVPFDFDVNDVNKIMQTTWRELTQVSRIPGQIRSDYGLHRPISSTRSASFNTSCECEVETPAIP
jgi:hypothetical protein